MFCFSYSCADFIFLHGYFLLTGFNFSIKILLAKGTLLLWILLCYMLNMSSFHIGSISWCCLAVLLFYSSSDVPLFRGILIFPSVFCCSASVSVFCQCSSVPSVFCCSVGVPARGWRGGGCRGKRAKKGPKQQKNFFHISGTADHMIVIFGAHV